MYYAIHSITLQWSQRCLKDWFEGVQFHPALAWKKHIIGVLMKYLHVSTTLCFVYCWQDLRVFAWDLITVANTQDACRSILTQPVFWMILLKILQYTTVHGLECWYINQLKLINLYVLSLGYLVFNLLFDFLLYLYWELSYTPPPHTPPYCSLQRILHPSHYDKSV